MPSSCCPSACSQLLVSFRRELVHTSGALAFIAATQGTPPDCLAVVTREADIAGPAAITEKDLLTGHTPGHSTEAAN